MKSPVAAFGTLAASLLLSFLTSAQQFEPKEITKTPGISAYGDLNNDGYADIVSIGNDLRINWGTPSLHITQGQIIEPGTVIEGGYTTCKVAYIDSDNFLDIVINQSAPNRIWIYHNNQDGTFTKSEIALTQTNPLTFLCADIDANGTTDLLLFENHYSYPSTQYNMVYYLLNNNGNFSDAYFATSAGTAFQKSYDINGDGRSDLHLLPHVYWNEPGNPFTIDYEMDLYHQSSSITDGVFTDLNLDGMLDYVYISSSSALFGKMATAVNPLQLADVYCELGSSYSVSDLEVFNVDADPNPEVLFTAAGKVCAAKYNATTSQLDTIVLYQQNSISHLDLIDYNNDGFTDLMMGGSFSGQQYVALNDGNNHFTDVRILQFVNEAGGFAVDEGDIDGDGLEDMLFYSNNHIVWTKQLSAGSYSNLKPIDNTYDCGQLDLADIDNDGDKDIIASQFFGYSSETDDELLNYYLNNGSGTFTGPFNIIEDIQGKFQKVVDMDNDGYKDIVLTQWNSSGHVQYFRNTHPGFVLQQTVAPYTNATGLPFEITDLDNNGFKDIVTFLNATELHVYYNNGTTFSSGTLLYIFTSQPMHNMIGADLDNDSDMDFIFSRGSGNNAVTILRNDGGSYAMTHYPIANTGYLDEVTYMDFDNDGLKDVVFDVGDSLVVMKNTGSAALAAPEYYNMGNRFTNFKEIKNAAGTVTDIVAQDFTGGLYSLKRFLPGATPVLAQTTFNVCPGENVTVTVTNAAALNDNATWGIFADNCSGTLLATSTTGTFTFSSQQNATYYVKATGNSIYSGNCSTFTMNLTGANPPVTVSAGTPAATGAVVNIASPQSQVNWEYQLNGAAWTSVSNVANTLTIPGLLPNTDYTLLVRPAGMMGACPGWVSQELNVTTLCDVVESWDTISGCLYSEVTLPNFQHAQMVSNPDHFDVTLPAFNGCDSIVHVTVVVPPPLTSTDVQSACGPFTWIDGITYYASNNTATYSLPGITTCDSIITLDLTIHTPVYGTDVQTSCGPFTWIDGYVYTTSNSTSTHTLTSVVTGCDSIVTLNLTIIAPVYGTDTQTACGSYTWIDGNTYTASNTTATHTLTSALTGCDSIVTLDLTILSPTGSTQTETALNSYFWPENATTYTTSGTYTHTLVNAAGCDSVITLDLTILVLDVSTFTTPSDLNDCTGTMTVTADGMPDFIFDIGGGVTPVTSSTGSAVFENLCTGIYSLLTTDGNGDTLGSVFVIPGETNFILIDPFGSGAAIADSIGATVENCDVDFATIDTAYISSYVLVAPDTLQVVWTVTDQFQTVLVPVSYVLDAGPGNYYLQLQLYCPQKTTDNAFVISEGVYFDGQDISTLSLGDLAADRISIWPNPSQGEVTIAFEGPAAVLTIKDLNGRSLMSRTVVSGETVDIAACATGVYVFELTTAAGTHIRRIVKH